MIHSPVKRISSQGFGVHFLRIICQMHMCPSCSEKFVDCFYFYDIHNSLCHLYVCLGSFSRTLIAEFSRTVTANVSIFSVSLRELPMDYGTGVDKAIKTCFRDHENDTIDSSTARGIVHRAGVVLHRFCCCVIL